MGQIACDQRSRAAYAQRIVIDVLVLHGGGVELYANAVVEDLIG